MRITHHGGECCGIKHIMHLGKDPEAFLYRKGKTENVCSQDRAGEDVRSCDNFYHHVAPREKYIERFDRYLDFLRRTRPYGTVEVSIVRQYAGGVQAFSVDLRSAEGSISPIAPVVHPLEEFSVSYQDRWVPYLRGRRFKKVNEFSNSNSGNIVTVYHLNMNKKWHDFWDNYKSKRFNRDKQESEAS